MNSQNAKQMPGGARSAGVRAEARTGSRRNGMSFGKPLAEPSTNTIAAIPVVLREDGQPELGPISHLAASAHFEYLGEGFNASTMQVRCGDLTYFVFREDVNGIRRVGS